MTETVNEDPGVGRSVDEGSNGQRSQPGEALSEWRSSGQVENGTPSTSTSLTYWDTDEDDDYGPKPSELFGKHEWKIPKFLDIKKRDLRSSAFEAGGYKWRILIYPQGCDVSNHLSLFLSVANYEKLLPGWSHFALFTISVLNKDSTKTKYSDALHRFWKKEHDWGWRKFMELSKLQEGFIDDSDSLTIDAQVQVIRERVDRPFRCLDRIYRRKLARVYNIEQIYRRFLEERRYKLERFIEDKAKLTSFRVFWLEMDQNSRHQMCREKMDVILKGVVKHFSNEKDVASTLVMDYLYSGLKALESQSKNKIARPRLLNAKELPSPIVRVDKDMFVLVDDVLLLLEQAALDPSPRKDEKSSQNRTKDGNDGEEVKTEANERAERHLTELSRRTVEIFVLTHIFSKIEVAYQEAISLKRQEELIREEEEASLAETEQRVKKGAAEREKKSKKKQAKQKRNKNKGKGKRKEEKVSFATHENDLEENQNDEEEKHSITEKAQSSAEKPDTLGDVSDKSDSVNGSADILQPDLEDRDSSSAHWDTEAFDVCPPSSEVSNRGKDISTSTANGISERKNHSTMDDSSSTCSNDSIRSGVTSESYLGNALRFRNHKSPNQRKDQHVKVISDANYLASKTDDQPSVLGTDPKSESYSSEANDVGQSDWVVVSHIHEQKSSWNHIPVGKERNMAQTISNSVDMDKPNDKIAAVLSSPRSVAKIHSPLTQTKPEKKSVSTTDSVPNWKVVSATGPPSSSHSQTVGLRADMQKISAPKQAATKPSSAPIIPSGQPTHITVSSSVQRATSLPGSVSSACRLGPDTSLHNQQTYVPQSYKQAIVGNSLVSSSSFNHHPKTHGVVVPTTLPSSSYSETPTSSYHSSFPFSQQDGELLWTGRNLNPGNIGMNNPYTPTATSNTSLNHIDIQMAQQQTQSLMTDEFPHIDIINDLLEDEHGSNMLCNGSIFNPQPQMFNGQHSSSYHGDVGLSGEFLCGSSRSRSFGEDGYYYMPHLSGGRPYVDGSMPIQWQMGNMEDVSLSANYQNTYSGFGYSSPSFTSGINGYTGFRPSNSH